MHDVIRRIKNLLAFLQTSWSIAGVTLIVLALTIIGSHAIFWLRDRWVVGGPADLRLLAEGYGGQTWPVVHQAELDTIENRWQPFVYYRPQPFRGQTMNIDGDGLRTTWLPPDEAEPVDTKVRTVKILARARAILSSFDIRIR